MSPKAHGRIARRLRDTAEAERELAAARALFEEMRMTFWLERMGLDRVGPGKP